MNKYIMAFLLVCAPIFTANSRGVAKYNKDINYSLFPLQDQVRFYNQDFKLPEDFDKKMDIGAFALYNLRINKGILEYDVVGDRKDECGASCFANGIYLGKFAADIRCGGQIYEDGYEKDDEFVLEKRECRDISGRVIWEEELGDSYVFDENGNLLYYKDYNSVTTYNSGLIIRQIVYSKNEFKLYDKDDKEAFFHVKYQRDDKDRIIRETHFNQIGFPYNIYEAEYVGDACQKITKIDSYNKKKEIYKFSIEDSDEDNDDTEEIEDSEEDDDAEEDEEAVEEAEEDTDAEKADLKAETEKTEEPKDGKETKIDSGTDLKKALNITVSSNQ